MHVNAQTHYLSYTFASLEKNIKVGLIQLQLNIVSAQNEPMQLNLAKTIPSLQVEKNSKVRSSVYFTKAFIFYACLITCR